MNDVKKTYVVYSVLESGYWDSNQERFRGPIFATHYDSDDSDEIMAAVAMAATPGTLIEIKTIYSKAD